MYGAAGIYVCLGCTLLDVGIVSVFRVTRRDAREHSGDGGVFAATPIMTPFDTEFDENQLGFEFDADETGQDGETRTA